MVGAVNGAQGPTRAHTPTATTLTNTTLPDAALPLRQVDIARSGSDTVLSWTPDPAAVAYRIYRDDEPYFSPPLGSPYAQTTNTSFTDAGVLGDPAVHHFYVVTSVDSSGAETAYDNRVGAFDFALVTATLNDIAVPLDVSAVITNADSLADWIDPVHVLQVLKWDAGLGQFLSWSNENGFGDNFPVHTGDSVFLTVGSTPPPTASFVGRVPAAGSLHLDLQPGSSAANCGLNTLSLPLDQAQLTNADQLSDDIGGVLQALDWDAGLGNFFAWSNQFNFGENFTTRIGYPYLVCLDETAPGTWPPDGGATWTLVTPSQSPSARSGHDMVYDAARGGAVLCGGQNIAGNYDPTTWVWNGVTWVAYQASPSPCARSSHTMAYDSARQRVVLFGGFNSEGILDDTWEWNGFFWTEKTSGSAPPGRFLHAMAYDAARGRVVMFGGFDGQVYINDTWVWNGDQWSERNPANSPPPLCGHWMAYDAARGKVVAFGGTSPVPPNQRNDTWEWDGNTWTLRAPATSPPARCCLAMAYDSARQRTVMFGGNDGSVPIGGTWEWTGTTWLQPSLALSPSARQATGMAYHAGQGRMVLFGGQGAQGRLGDTWIYEPEVVQSVWSPIIVSRQ